MTEPKAETSLERGVFMISIDTELAWGCFDRADREERWRLEERSREVIRRLLELFERYSISATWAVVGHLFLSSCDHCEGRTHPEVARPQHDWLPGDWFQYDPGTCVERDPLWYAPDVIEQLQQGSPEQEIASHSFSHLLFADRGCSREAATADLRECVAAAKRANVSLHSFVYPRNRIAYLDLLPANGFACYRGADPQWYGGWPRIAKRLAHYADDLLALPPPTVLPRREGSLWNIPGSVMLQGMDGIRKWIPARCRTVRGLAGLRRAAARRQLFHLWFHPINFAVDMEAMLACLEPVLKRASELRDRGELEVLTMGELAARLSGQTATKTASR
jgi:peptidoglycan/xylan/chitin deacetylase (PgdA/CDA1 family)